jgi:uncharacterized protein with HEPN domain
MPKRSPKVRLQHMLDYARKAVEMARGQTKEDLHRDEKLRFALTHLVELVGEAAGRVPHDTLAQSNWNAKPAHPRV